MRSRAFAADRDAGPERSPCRSARPARSGFDGVLAPLVEEPWPSLLGLANKYDIGETGEVVLVYRNPWAADDREGAAALELIEDFLHPLALDVHAGHAHDIGPGAAGKIDRLDVLVDEGDLMSGRGQCREKGQIGN